MSGNPRLLLHPTFSTENLKTLADNKIEYQIGKLDTLAITSTRQFEGIVIAVENHQIVCDNLKENISLFKPIISLWLDGNFQRPKLNSSKPWRCGVIVGSVTDVGKWFSENRNFSSNPNCDEPANWIKAEMAKKAPGRSKVWMLGNGIVIREKEILTVDQSVLRDKVENNERWEEIGDKRKMNPWQFHFEQKLCSWYLGHLHNNGTQVGGKENTKKQKSTKKILDTIQ